MRTLPVGVGLVSVLAGGAVVGCDDDRGAVAIGGGGGSAAQAGTPGDHAGGSGSEGGSGGSRPEGGAGGARGDCPSDVPAAVGASCRGFAEGNQCQDEDHDTPCGTEAYIRCESGTWRWLEAAGCGGAGGAGGSGGAPECPEDIAAADGEACDAYGEGYFCSDGGTDPCQFGNSIICQGGEWQRQEAFPAPCGGAGGAG